MILILLVIFIGWLLIRESNREHKDRMQYYSWCFKYQDKQKPCIDESQQRKEPCSECGLPLENAYYTHAYIKDKDIYTCYVCNGFKWRSPTELFYASLEERDRFKGKRLARR